VTLCFKAVEESQIYPLPARAWLEINASALRSNAVTLQQRTGLPLIAMVKSNAYGVGVAGVVRALEQLPPMAYGVATVAEGEAIRAMGIERPVLVVTPVLEEEFSRAQAANLTLALGDAESIETWASKGLPYHLSIDTGMNRAGVPWRDAATLRDAVRRWPPLGSFTHLHSAEFHNDSASVQIRRFLEAVDAIGGDLGFLHVENSAGSARGIDGHGRLGAIRPGIFLYGIGSGSDVSPMHVVALRARVVDVRWMEPGDTVSYGATYKTLKKERIATVAAGYGDGYPRALSGKAVGWLHGRRIQQRGLVTMDMTMFDVTDEACEVGDVVTMIGGEASPEMSIEGIARKTGESPYVIINGLSARLERHFIEG
jgi:alanine racemase